MQNVGVCKATDTSGVSFVILISVRRVQRACVGNGGLDYLDA